MTSKKQPPAARVVRPRVNPHTDPTEGKTGNTEDILNSLTVEELREYINYTRWNQTFGTFDTGQLVENRRALFWIILTYDRTFRLVVEQYLRQVRLKRQPHRAAVDPNHVGWHDTGTNLCHFAVDGDTAAGNQCFHVAPGTNTRQREQLVQPLRHGIGIDSDGSGFAGAGIALLFEGTCHEKCLEE